MTDPTHAEQMAALRQIIERLDLSERKQGALYMSGVLIGLRALLARLEADEWRPISEYPADNCGWGPNVLLFVPTGLVAPASDYRTLTGRMEAEFWMDWDDTGSMGNIGDPTHWRPLPAPPEERGA